MKEFSLSVLIAVLEETFGRGLFWGLIALVILITLGFVVTVVRERRLEARRLVRAEIMAPLGALAALGFVFWITNSRPADIGGPIDWVILAGIALLGAGGAVMASYALLALLPRPPRKLESSGRT